MQNLKRRVKCDEGKPFCNRCRNYGADCEGYEDLNFKPTKRASLTKIAPRSSHDLAVFVHSPTISPSTTTFQDSREHMYFLHFQEETAIELSGPFNASLWNYVVPQSCQNEPVLRQLSASIGALHKATRLRGLSHGENEAKSHQQYSLQQYGQAIKGIQRIVYAQHPGFVRTALIASLLIYCFENLHGEFNTAILHMESALQLMHKQLSRISRGYRHLQNTSPTPALEDDVVAAFVRLDNGLMSRPDKSNAETPESRIAKGNILDIDFSEDMHNIPDKFSNIAQARNYLESFQFLVLPSLAQDFAAQINGPDSLQTTDGPSIDMYRTMSSQLQQWNTAFAPLYAAAYTPHHNGKSFVAEAMLRVQALAANLVAQRICTRDIQNSPGIFIRESREIVDLSRWVAASPSFRKTFVFDCGIVPGLFMVVVTCLDISIRKEALQILKDIVPRRESAWDSATLVKIGEMVLHKEG